jgi:hypothetical protein
MDTSSQDWAELEYLTAHIGRLQRRRKAAQAMAKISKCFGAIKAIETEIATTTAMRKRLVNRLTEELASQITAPATPAEA